MTLTDDERTALTEALRFLRRETVSTTQRVLDAAADALEREMARPSPEETLSSSMTRVGAAVAGALRRRAVNDDPAEAGVELSSGDLLHHRV